MRTVAFIPAHNEQENIADAIQSLQNQTVKVDEIIVIADNCTDNTVGIAQECGAYVYSTCNNREKKAGALNLALEYFDPLLKDEDAVLILDADSMLTPHFVEVARNKLALDYGAVGGIFSAKSASRLVEYLQEAEYVRYAREIARRKGKARVITGTGALFNVAALRHVKATRGVSFYDTCALTEDNEMTLALKHLGWKVVSPRECVVYTEVMPSWTRLWRQRVRWQRGALENLKSYGVTRYTLPYFGQQLMMCIGIISMLSLLALTALVVYLSTFTFVPLFLVFPAIFYIERVVTIQRAKSRKVRVLTYLFIFELMYDIFQQMVYIKCYVDFVLRRKSLWNSKVIGG